MLEVVCEHCGRTLRIPEECLGQTGRCNHCQGAITVTVAPPKFSAEVIRAAAEEEEEQERATNSAFHANADTRVPTAEEGIVGHGRVPPEEAQELTRDGGYTMAHGRRVSAAKFSEMVDRNLKGIELEKMGHEETARILYEANLAEGFGGSHPYERLRVIYTRRKDFEQAMRVCREFQNLNQRDPKKTSHFAKHLEKLMTKAKRA